MANPSSRHWNKTTLMATHVKKTWINYCCGEESRNISFTSCRKGLQCLLSQLSSVFWKRRNTMINSPLKQTNKKIPIRKRSQDGWRKEARSNNMFKWQLKPLEEEHPYPCVNWVPFALRQNRSTNCFSGSLSCESWFENGCGTVTSYSYSCFLGVLACWSICLILQIIPA